MQVMNSQPVRNEYSIQNYLSLSENQTKMRQPNETNDKRLIDGTSEASCFFLCFEKGVYVAFFRGLKNPVTKPLFNPGAVTGKIEIS